MKLSELKQDTKNSNRGTKRGRESVAKSLEQFGAGRSVLIDRDGNLIAGNTTAQQASAAGIDDVIVVQTDGTQLVAVQRTDLSIDDPKARALAIADNRTSELGLDWDADVLKDLIPDLSLQPFFSTDEIAAILGVVDDSVSETAPSDSSYKAQYGVIVICKDEADQRDVYDRLTAGGLECKVVVT